MSSRDSSVGIATGYALYDRKSRVFSLQRPDRLRASPSLLPKGYRGLFAWIKRSGRDSDHSPATSAEDNKAWVSHPLPHVFMA
jgi:hypothetical protein